MARIICPNCSNAFSPAVGTVPECPKCHYRIEGYSAQSLSSPSFASGATAVSAPVMPVPEPAPASPSGSSNGIAIASMVLGIVGIPMFVLFIPSLLALILGIVGAAQVRKHRQKGLGMAVTGIVLGTLVLVGWLVFFIGLAIFEF